MLDKLRKVQHEAQQRHEYVSDQEMHGEFEHWEPGLMGDCEDYALWCRERLEGLGVESELIYCKTESGIGHLVLSVKGWILDCRFKDVVSRDDLQYEWLKLGDALGNWFEIVG